MKEELQTEDVVGYLPYGLELEVNHKVFNTKEKRILSFDCGHDIYNKLESGCVKPILIPLHSLTKDQLVHFSICFRLWYDKPNFDYKLMIYQDIETCHKLHVDYRGLIEKGLAIKK